MSAELTCPVLLMFAHWADGFAPVNVLEFPEATAQAWLLISRVFFQVKADMADR